MKYDIFKHGTNVTVLDKTTGKIGKVKEIKETAHEWIEPFVDFGDGQLTRCETEHLTLISEVKHDT